MSEIHIAEQNEALDMICYRHYGQQAGAVERVLEANPEIKLMAHRLRLGTKIYLPDLFLGAGSMQRVKLWD